MAIASFIVQAKKEAFADVQRALAEIPEVTPEDVSPNGDIVVVVETDDINVLQDMGYQIQGIPGVLGVFPAYLTTADELPEE